MDYLKMNKKFWNKWSRDRGPWSRKCSKERLEKARSGVVEMAVTTEKPVPQDWLPKKWKGLDVLGLAAGGGQQIPLMAAAGANVTSFDFSEEQLKRDLEVCEEEGLTITTQKGEMEDLSVFSDESFDFILNPVSTCYTKNVRKVYQELYRILRPKGVFITGFLNPVFYSLNKDYNEKKEMKLIYPIPYSDVNSLSEKEIENIIKESDSFEFGHSLSDLIGGQIETGFKITGFYESYWGKEFPTIIDKVLPVFIATKACK